ncbi:pectate lyase family protein [Vibrio palustris]|uniref:Pectate lyase A n=1 Tax=Vibrio palustris TaxID=1918946 RepID=A0A1R4B4S5_9VIBR|nr:pectate lyase [Vibrio palustris]SJL83903.1 Pectate lyase A precursor [Vibrio palustris]
MSSFSKKLSILAVTAALSSLTITANADQLLTNTALEAASSGFATLNNGTTGGARADAKHIYIVSNISQFKQALSKDEEQPRIIQVQGTIDVTGGQPYRNFDDQKARSQLKIPSNTTIIGVTADAGFKHGSLVVRKANNVIIRNLTLESPVDVEPHFEKGDGWNAEWDSMTIAYAQNVWVDHVTFDDGSFTDADYGEKDGWEYVRHDGMLDIKRASDFVTISYSVFKNHNKTMLIGHSKSNASEDRGHLRVTLADNVFSKITQRTPRVRFGNIHVFNNLFEGDYKDPTYRYMYSFGLGYEGSIQSQYNVFDIDNLKTSKQYKVAKVYQSNSSLTDTGSTFNGSPLDLEESDVPNAASWSIPYNYTLYSTEGLGDYLKATAGAGNLAL